MRQKLFLRAAQVEGAQVVQKGTRFSTFMVGAAGYSGLEVLWRGETHWTMALTGGACLVGLQAIARRFGGKPLWVQGMLGAGLITTAEFLVGAAVNLWLRWDVWDYSAEAGNLLGQVCPLYSFYWFCLSVPACALLRRSRR